MNTRKNIILISVIIYGLSTIISYLIFANTSILTSTGLITTPVPPPVQEGGPKDGRLVFDPELPKTEICPINGEKYSKQQKQWWEKHRPLGIMIENHEESRPQSGLSYSDMVYEAVAEGGITRFLAIFYCQDAGTVGPVRSARTYFLDFISEYGEYPLYAHVGGANTPGPANALGQIEDYGWQLYNDLNQFAIGFPTYWRDPDRLGHPVATEHTMYSTTQNLWKIGEKRKLTNVDEDGVSWDESYAPFLFKPDAASSLRPSAQTISFDFWKGYPSYSVKWVYEKTTNNYTRSNGGLVHKDKDNDVPLTSKNIVILFMTESAANDGYEGNVHRLYGTKGSGKAIVFQDGKEIQATWKKANRTSRLKLTANGQEVKFNPGRIWFEIVPLGNVVSIAP
jgi:hypothetical protein